MVRRLLPALFALVACGGSAHTVRYAAPARAMPTGAVMLAHAGSALPFMVGVSDAVRGRARLHIDADGTTRARDVLAEPISQAIAVPSHLGGGVVLVSEQGVAHATNTLRPIFRGAVSSVSIGANELWARERTTSDWVRVDLAKGVATRELPPIAAPILTTWSTVGAHAGKSQSAGPEFGTQTFALAIVDLLGPVISRDAGATWSPINDATVRAAFPLNGPNRVVRDGNTLLLASDDRSVPVLSSGAFGAPVLAPQVQAVPDAAAIRLEQLAPFGVPLKSGDVLLADGGRLAVLELEPVRIDRTSRAAELTRCDLAPSKQDLAIAACLRHHEGSGGQLAVGSVVDDTSPRFVADRTFPYGTSHRFSATSALAVAATCAGTSEGGIDLLSATKVCVRDVEGRWSDLAVAPISGRRHLLPRADGGVLIARDDATGRVELVALSRNASSTTIPLRLRLDMPSRELIGLEEVVPGRFTLWRRGATDLRALVIEVTDSHLSISVERPRALLDATAIVGTHGDHAMIADLTASKTPPARVEASITSDGGRTWGVQAWPEGVRPLDTTSSGRRIECGAVGCRLFGWTRLGWHERVSSYDRVVSLEDAPTLAARPAPSPRSKVIRARCSSTGSATIPAASVPLATPSYPQQPNDVLLGLPAPKLPKDHVQVLTPFTSRNVRGGYVTVGPVNGLWGDKARTFARFASDLDPLGAVHETPTFASPFPDRISAQMSWGSVRRFEAAALGPGRVLVVTCLYSRCDVMRLGPNVPPERVDLGDVTMTKFINARELGDNLAIFGLGTHRDAATPTRVFESSPFVAIVDARGTTVSFLARAGWGDLPGAVMTVDATRGLFGVRSTSTAPTWTDGAAYVVRLGLDGRPAGAFETLLAPSPEISRPTKACGPSASGWDEADVAQSRVLHLTIDGGTMLSLDALAGALRTRVSSTSACLERLTALSRSAAFQLDAATGQAQHLALDPDGKGGKKTSLTCTLDWE